VLEFEEALPRRATVQGGKQVIRASPNEILFDFCFFFVKKKTYVLSCLSSFFSTRLYHIVGALYMANHKDHVMTHVVCR
jgi:hypothetical protein